MIFRKLPRSVDLPALIEGCVQGKPWAQKQLFNGFYGLAKSVCLRYASSREEAEEMIDDGFLKVFAKLTYYDPEQPFEAWFRTVLIHSAIDHFRRHHARLVFSNLEDAEELEHDDYLIERLTADEILELVQRLPPAYRTVFSLHVVDGYSHPKIGKLLGINEGTSRSNLSKARVQLQTLVTRYITEDFTKSRLYV